MRRIRRIALITLLALAASVASALAATPAQIHRDAADGSIDGSYSLEEMRGADRSVSAEQREYYGWEDVYSSYIRSLSNPDEVPPAIPVDRNRDGRIDSAERAAAKKVTRAKCTKATPKAQRSKVCQAVGVETPAAEPDDAEPRDDDNEPADTSSRDEDDGGSPLIWLIAGIPLLVVALGAWRMRTRGKRGPDA